MVPRGNRQKLPGDPDDRIPLEVHCVRGIGAVHPDAGDDQDGAEEIDDPGEALQQECSEPDHHGAHHDGAEDAPLQHLGLELGGHIEVLEDQDEDEQVVDRE